MTGPFIGECPVLENSKLARGTFLLRLHAPAIAAKAAPGQFVMVRTGPAPEKGGSPLLKRPLSLHRLGPGEEISLLYRVVGVGTDLLARLRPGDRVELLGPLGRGFNPDLAEDHAYLVGGGIGVAPLLALSEKLGGGLKPTLIYGERNAADLLPESRLDLFSGPAVLTTDDGSRGIKGMVTGPLADALAERPAPVFACGPKPMLAAVAVLAEKYGVPAQVSLEARMACGMGACLGCSTHMKNAGYALVCAHGPVFAAEEVQWQPFPI